MEIMKKDQKPEITPENVQELISAAQIMIPETGLYEKLKSAETEGKRLRVKMGFDPTSPDLHLGHAVAMRQLRKFQDLGHKPVVIIGDFTGLIGDPSERNQSRPLASKEQLDKNAETYISQLSKILNIDDVEIHKNSEWLSTMSLTEVIHLLAQGTLGQIISRDDFRKRLDSGSPIALHEIIYPFLQGTDSLAIDADIELGGVDQLYAFQAARTLQTNRGDEPEIAIMMPLLRGTDGTKKMSKSIGNYIGLNDEPRDMFGKVMSIPDNLIEEYLTLASGFSSEETKQMIDDIKNGRNPMEVKILLANNITETYHSAEAADDAFKYFEKQFRNKQEEAIEFAPAVVDPNIRSVVDLLIGLGVADSKNKSRRLIEGGGVTINGQKIIPGQENLDNPIGLKVKVGPRRFFETKEK